MLRPALSGAVLATTLTLAAQAQPASGPYLGGSLGANLREAADSHTGRTRIVTEWGHAGVLALGWGFGNGLRLEAEGTYRNNDVQAFKEKRVNGLVLSVPNQRGRLLGTAAMVNAAYDFDLASFGLPLRPYVGAGVGYGWLNDHGIGGTENVQFSPTVVVPARRAGSGTKGELAYQAFGGVAWPVPGVPGLSLTAEYRFFAMDNVRFQSTRILYGVPAGYPSRVNGRGNIDYHNHSILVGVRYSLNDLAQVLGL